MKTGKVAHAYLGVSTQDSSGGAQVASVAGGSPAATAGLRTGDVITAVGGQAVTSSAALSSLVDSHKVGDGIQLSVKRGGGSTTVGVTLGQRPNSTQADTATQSQQPQSPGLGGGW
jgi:putative serine protease PepD